MMESLNDQISYAASIISNFIVESRLKFTTIQDSASMTPIMCHVQINAVM